MNEGLFETMRKELQSHQSDGEESKGEEHSIRLQNPILNTYLIQVPYIYKLNQMRKKLK